MCGIFGIVLGENSSVTPKLFEATAKRLFKLSETRGKESAGLAISNGGLIQVYKDAVPASRMIRSPEYNKLVRDIVKPNTNERGRIANPVTFIGHSRLVTNGAQENNENNQPVIAGGMVGVHNGIIVNNAALYDEFPDIERRYEVDTEVLLCLIRHYAEKNGSMTKAARAAFRRIRGTASVAILFKDLDYILLATNNGSLYCLSSKQPNLCIFASERYILSTLASNRDLRDFFTLCQITRVEPNHACFIRLADLRVDGFLLDAEDEAPSSAPPPGGICKSIHNLSAKSERVEYTEGAPHFTIHTCKDDVDLLYQHQPYVDRLRRCSRCILPETMPYIRFDENGVCNYCRSHVKTIMQGEDALKNLVASFPHRHGEPDCLVAFSGGRDSSFGLHYLKNVLGLNPITYTYDWGMVTDLARRNIARMCGALGIEHILVSADIQRKRRNIAKNILAWLKKPELGVVPLFMAGDKQYFYHANRLRKQTGIQLVLLCANPFETTNFKNGFADSGSSRRSVSMKMRLLMYYGIQFLRNPAYLNSSIWDTFFAYYSYYLMPCEYVNIYLYKQWDEEEVDSTLRKEYDWEVASHTSTTWRIGDGTAAFYNYIYHCVAGITENDTFRSNQIREGMIDRNRALELVEAENRAGYESIKWYLRVIGLGREFNEVIRTINSIPKRYQSVANRAVE